MTTISCALDGNVLFLLLLLVNVWQAILVYLIVGVFLGAIAGECLATSFELCLVYLRRCFSCHCW